MRIALANLPYPRTADESVALAEQGICEAGRSRAEIVCFPECYVPGYRVGKPVPPPSAAFLERAWEKLADAARMAKVAVILGTERMVDGKARMTTLVIGADGEWLGFQDKVQLDPSEDGTFAAGSERRVFHCGALTFGIAICHEGWRYPETVRWAATRGAQVVFHPHFHEAEEGSYRPTTFADPLNTFHEKALLCRAAENTCFIAAVNCATEGSGTTSAFINPDGTVLSYQPYGRAGLLIADLRLSKATRLLASRLKDYS